MSLVSVTMEGTAENRGVIYRTLEKLFSLSEERSDLMTYEVSVSMLEVYNETIRGLLVKDAKNPANKLEVKQEVQVRVHKTDEVLELLKSGSRARSVGSTNANEFSSRSHCLLRVRKNLVNGQQTRSRLWLVDLVGSERQEGKTGAERDFEAYSSTKELSSDARGVEYGHAHKQTARKQSARKQRATLNISRITCKPQKKLAKKAKHDGEGTEKLQEKFCNLESEPAEEHLDQPARVVPAQEKFLEDSRYAPVKAAASVFVLLKDLRPLTDAPSSTTSAAAGAAAPAQPGSAAAMAVDDEPQPPQPFEYST
ncbi:kinesin-like protein KIN-14S [Tanacetum coccineum]